MNKKQNINLCCGVLLNARFFVQAILCALFVFGSLPFLFAQNAPDGADSSQMQKVSGGVLVVANGTVLAEKTIPLSGEWEFYPSVFIEPLSEPSVRVHLVPVPASWKSYKLGKPFDSGAGSGSFRLVIRGLTPYKRYAFPLYDVCATAMRCFANGVLVGSAGVPDEDWTKTKEDQSMDIASFAADSSGCVELVFHVSNSFHRSGGIWTIIQFGEESVVKKAYTSELKLNFLFLGTLFTIFLYHFFLFLFRKYDFASLFLSLFTLSILARIMATPFCLLKIYFPLPYAVILRMEYTALFSGALFFLLYARLQIAQKSSLIVLRVLCILASILGCMVYFLPLYVGCRLVQPCQIFTIMITLYVIGFIVHSNIKNPTSTARLMILSSLFILVGTVHDVLAISYIPIFLSETMLVPYSFILFAFFQSAITARQFEQSHKAIAVLSDTLVKTNKAYYRFVPKEFLSLLSKKNIVDVNLGEWISRNMTLFSADIRNFTTISESLDGKTVFDLLNRYLMCIAPIIRKHNGFIEKYLGDGIVALFPGDGREAFMCAVAIQLEMVQLRRELAAESLPRLDVGIGIHYGRIVLGTVGDRGRMNEIVLSKSIEMVMQLEALTKDYRRTIIASKTAVETWCIDDLFSVTVMPEGPAQHFGVKEPVFAIASDVLEPLPM